MRVFPVLREDVHQGVVWLTRPGMASREVVKITNTSNKKSIHVEALKFEENFLNAYNQPGRAKITDPANSLVIGGWHRALLGDLPTKEDVPIAIKSSGGWWGRFQACVDHPQTVVRVAAWLSAIGLALGILGAVLGALPYMWNPATNTSTTQHRELTMAELPNVLLSASLRDGYLAGKYFNQTPDTVITHITVEAVPQEEKNPFNAAAPRFFEVAAAAQPRAMSSPFAAETGPLNPEFHTLRVVGAKGFRR
ncbi:hypothetical protein FN976_11065 [Caenimonas sedimenti]|uniref:Uncharacterized protein n=1 Tax=Caenimonas sedimenti TaxID=2596921 RepID=A0A562ZSY6_9BURK|nr:hypothetical protein [Caenimonas sedimenti]TWO71448.1 hypothetical protein FN976_11065 [Caenimonas sedimenti]